MREGPDDHRRLLDGGDDLQLAAALRAVFEDDIEYAAEHRSVVFFSFRPGTVCRLSTCCQARAAAKNRSKTSVATGPARGGKGGHTPLTVWPDCRWSGLAFIHFVPYVLLLDRIHAVSSVAAS